MGKTEQEFLNFLRESGEKAKASFIQYLKIEKDSLEIREKAQYLQSLIDKAHDLPLSTVLDLREDLRVINSEISRLKMKEEEIMKVLGENFRNWSQSLKKYEKLPQKVKELFYGISQRGLTEKRLSEVRKIASEIDEAVNHLERYSEIVTPWVKEEEFPLTNEGKRELERVVDLTKQLEKLQPPPSVNLSRIDKAWNLLGQDVINKEGEKIGFLADVYLSSDSFVPVLEIKKERELSNAQLRTLFNEIEEAYGKSSFHAFRKDISEEVRQLSALSNEHLTPTNIKLVLEGKNIPVQGFSELLKSEFLVVGYISYNVIVEQGDKQKVNEDKIRELPSNTFSIPCTVKGGELIGETKQIGEFNYSVKFHHYLPNIGYSYILLRRDREGAFLPSEKIVRKILATLRERREISREIGIRIKDNINDKSEAVWRLRMAVINGLKAREIGEREALRPKYLFPFCLKYGIPILFSELLQSYFDIIQGSKLQKLRIEALKSTPLEEMENDYFSNLLPRECGEFLGFRPLSTLDFQCTSMKSKEELIEILESRVGGKEKAEEIVSISSSIQRLIQILLLTRRIRNVSDYRELLTSLGQRHFPYKDIEDKLEGEVEQRIYRKAVSNFINRL